MSITSFENRRTVSCQFWACEFSDNAAFDKFVGENSDYYLEENEDGEVPLSHFAKTQGKSFYDHDFMEVGKVETGYGDATSIAGSWGDKWTDEFFRRAKQAEISATHFIMIMSGKQADGSVRYEFPDAVSYANEDSAIAYLGTIEFEE